LNRACEVEQIGILPYYCDIDSIFSQQSLQRDNPVCNLICWYHLQLLSSKSVVENYPRPGQCEAAPDEAAPERAFLSNKVTGIRTAVAIEST
jgi:hypothetical protein